MGKQYSGFSKQEHEETAQAVKSVCRQLSDLREKILPAYGVSSELGRVIQKLTLTPNVMSKLKDKLDDAYFGEHGGSSNDSPYYDGRGHSWFH